MRGQLEGKIAIATGWDSGIGRAIAEEIAKLFQRVEAELGTPDVLVSDAGVDAAGKPVAEMSLDDGHREIRTDHYGPFYCCQQFVRARRSREDRLLGETAAGQPRRRWAAGAAVSSAAPEP